MILGYELTLSSIELSFFNVNYGYLGKLIVENPCAMVLGYEKENIRGVESPRLKLHISD